MSSTYADLGIGRPIPTSGLCRLVPRGRVNFLVKGLRPAGLVGIVVVRWTRRCRSIVLRDGRRGMSGTRRKPGRMRLSRVSWKLRWRSPA